MSVKNIDIKEKYVPLTDTEDIIVEVSIGDSGDATGSYAVFLGTQFIEANAPANLGKKAAILLKKTTISVTVPDLLQESNHCSITVQISEGTNITQFGPYMSEVGNHLDTAFYIIQISHQ